MATSGGRCATLQSESHVQSGGEACRDGHTKVDHVLGRVGAKGGEGYHSCVCGELGAEEDGEAE
eukprot:2272428-Karenia_brevis.AAC.1